MMVLYEVRKGFRNREAAETYAALVKAAFETEEKRISFSVVTEVPGAEQGKWEVAEYHTQVA